MGTPTVTLIPSDPDAPITGPAGELLQPVTVADQQIRLRPPTQVAIEAEKAYITISFYEAGRRRNTSGGVALEEALVTVQELIDRLSSGAVNAPKTMGELIERYLDPDRIPDSGEPWSAKHRYNQERMCRLFVSPHIKSVRCKDVTRVDVQRVVNAAPTQGEGKRLKVLVGSILRFGIDEEYIGTPIESLMRKVNWQAQGRPLPPPKPKRQGASRLSVDPAKIPGLNDVYDLAQQFKARKGAPWCWEMMPIFAAFTGLRIGELIGLEASAVEKGPTRRVHVDRQFLELTQGFTPPKGGKMRYTRYPSVTPKGRHYPQGFPLEKMIANRKAEVEKHLKEMRASGQVITERDGLLFPAPRGGPWSQSNLNDRVFRPSATDAQWPRNANKRLKWTWHSFRHVFATYHMQEKGVPAAFVSDAMGHATVGITIDLYQNIADDSWAKLE